MDPPLVIGQISTPRMRKYQRAYCWYDGSNSKADNIIFSVPIIISTALPKLALKKNYWDTTI